MNVRLNYSIEFTAGFYFNDMLKMNNYKIRLAMMTATPDEESVNIAFERIKYFIGDSIDSRVYQQRQRRTMQTVGQCWRKNYYIA